MFVGVSLDGGGGAERRFFRLWRYLNDRGGELTILTNRSIFRSAVRAGLCRDTDEGASLRVFPDSGFIRLNLALYSELRRMRPDVVHLPLAQRVLVPLYFLLGLHRSTVVTHSMTANYFAHRTSVPMGVRVLSRYLWWLARRVDSLYEGFVPIYAAPLGFASRVRVAPGSFTDTDRLKPTDTNKDEGRVVFAGRLYWEKDPEVFVRALAELSAKSPELHWHAILAGDGPLTGAVRALVSSLGLNDRVTMGSYPDMAAVLNGSSIFVSLQRTENYPSQALLEAMAAGNAIVATNVGETHRLVKPGKTGVLVRANVSEIAGALASLLSRPDETRKLGEGSAKLVRSEHTIEAFASYIDRFWQEAASDSGVRAPVRS